MIYFLQKPFEKELNARLEYLSIAFNSYFFPIDRNQDAIILQSFPLTEDNIIVLYGHNYWIRDFFLRFGNDIRHRIKIVNSCNIVNRTIFRKQKNLYFSKNDERGRVFRYPGAEFNLPFDVTQSELEMLNKRNLPLMERIRYAYRKVA